jgi:hypothetical protein
LPCGAIPPGAACHCLALLHFGKGFFYIKNRSTTSSEPQRQQKMEVCEDRLNRPRGSTTHGMEDMELKPESSREKSPEKYMCKNINCILKQRK